MSDVTYNEGYLGVVEGQPGIFYRTWTPEKSRGRVLCVHAIGGNTQEFRKLALELTARSFSVEAFDLPGNGFSAPWKAHAQDALNIQLRVLKAVIRKSEDVVGIVCNSGGAVVTFLYAYGSRMNQMAGRMPLVFCDPAFSYDADVRDFVEGWFAFGGNSYASLEAALVAWDASSLGKMKFGSPQDKRDFVLGQLRPNGAGLTPLVSEERKNHVRHNVTEFRLLEGKECLPNPSMFLWGENSIFRSKYQAEIDHVFSISNALVIPDAGHPLSLTTELELEEVSNFLDKAVY